MVYAVSDKRSFRRRHEDQQKLVAEYISKNVHKDQMALLQSQLNTEVIQKPSVHASSLRKVLEHKEHASQVMLSYNIRPATLIHCRYFKHRGDSVYV